MAVDYVLCRKCVHAIDVTSVQVENHKWKYFCCGEPRGWFSGNDFWKIARPCERYDPIDKQICLKLEEEEHDHT